MSNPMSSFGESNVVSPVPPLTSRGTTSWASDCHWILFRVTKQLQHVSCGFLNRIFHQFKQGDRGNESRELGTGRKTHGRWKYYISTQFQPPEDRGQSGETGSQSRSRFWHGQWADSVALIKGPDHQRIIK